MLKKGIKGLFIFNLFLVILIILAYYQFFSYTGNAISSINQDYINTFGVFLGTSDKIDSSELNWISENFDVVIGQIGSPGQLKQYNPNVKYCAGRPLEYTWSNDLINLQSWGEENNRTYENALLHYQEDVFVQAQNMVLTKDSRVNNGMPDPKSQEWLDWATNDILTCSGYYSGNDCIYDCIWEDNAVYLPSGSYEQGYYGEGKTYTYYNIFPIISGSPNYNHPMIEDRFIAGKNLASRVSSSSGKSVFALPNVGASWPFMSSNLPYKELLTEHFSNVYVEWWLFDISGVKKPNYQASYSQEILETLSISKQGTKLYLQTPTYLAYATNERKILSLATFYLINNPNLYYSFNIYPSSEYPDSVRGSQHPSNFLWFNAIDYDIGDPTTNSYNKPDYSGNLNSNEHFVFESGQDPSNTADTYYVLGREYENALILVKLKPKESSSTGVNSITSHNLNNDFKLLNTDGTLGSLVSSISLKNNEAAILIKQEEGITNETIIETNITEEEILPVDESIQEEETEEDTINQEDTRLPQETKSLIEKIKDMSNTSLIILGVSILMISVLLFLIIRKTRDIY